MRFGEIAEEALYHGFLLGREVGHVVELMDVAQVGKHLLRIGHVLVDIVEVGEQKLSPGIEVVERLVDARRGHKALVKVADELDGVGHAARGLLPEEVADGDISR